MYEDHIQLFNQSSNMYWKVCERSVDPDEPES